MKNIHIFISCFELIFHIHCKNYMYKKRDTNHLIQTQENQAIYMFVYIFCMKEVHVIYIKVNAMAHSHCTVTCILMMYMK